MILWRIGFRVYTTRNSRALSDMVCDSPKRLMILWRIGLSFFTTRNSRDWSYMFAIPQEASKSRKNWVSFDNLEFRTRSDMFANLQKRFMILWRIGFDFTTRNFRALCPTCLKILPRSVDSSREINWFHLQPGWLLLLLLLWQNCLQLFFHIKLWYGIGMGAGLWNQGQFDHTQKWRRKPPLGSWSKWRKGGVWNRCISSWTQTFNLLPLCLSWWEILFPSLISVFLFFYLPAKKFQISKSSCNLKAAVVALTGYSEVEVRTAVCQVCPCPATNSRCILWRWMC